MDVEYMSRHMWRDRCRAILPWHRHPLLRIAWEAANFWDVAKQRCRALHFRWIEWRNPGVFSPEIYDGSLFGLDAKRDYPLWSTDTDPETPPQEPLP